MNSILRAELTTEILPADVLSEDEECALLSDKMDDADSWLSDSLSLEVGVEVAWGNPRVFRGASLVLLVLA